MARKKFISLDVIEKDDWVIKASSFKNYILLVILNRVTGAFAIQHVDDEYKANLIIEYIIEKGEL